MSTQRTVSKPDRSQAESKPRPSAPLAWAITIGEAILLLGMAYCLADYWLMLPVWMRTLGAIVLASLALLGSIRVGRFLWKLRTPRNRPEPDQKPERTAK